MFFFSSKRRHTRYWRDWSSDVCSSDLAEDLTQETFVRVFRSLADFSPGTFEGWLHRITTNLFLDMVRRRQRIRFDALPEDTERLPGTSPSPEQVRSEEHTSELQSRQYLVCRLLL